MDASAGIGVMESAVQSLFAFVLMVGVAMAVAGAIKLIVYALEALQKKKRVAAAPTSVSVAVAPEPSQADETARHVAAVAAAVYATLGAARLVYIGDGVHSPVWTSTGRTIHQTSHLPKRAPKR